MVNWDYHGRAPKEPLYCGQPVAPESRFKFCEGHKAKFVNKVGRAPSPVLAGDKTNFKTRVSKFTGGLA